MSPLQPDTLSGGRATSRYSNECSTIGIGMDIDDLCDPPPPRAAPTLLSHPTPCFVFPPFCFLFSLPSLGYWLPSLVCLPSLFSPCFYFPPLLFLFARSFACSCFPPPLFPPLFLSWLALKHHTGPKESAGSIPGPEGGAVRRSVLDEEDALPLQQTGKEAFFSFK